LLAAVKAAARARSAALAAPAPMTASALSLTPTLLITQLAPISFTDRFNRGGGGIPVARDGALY